MFRGLCNTYTLPSGGEKFSTFGLGIFSREVGQPRGKAFNSPALRARNSPRGELRRPWSRRNPIAFPAILLRCRTERAVPKYITKGGCADSRASLPRLQNFLPTAGRSVWKESRSVMTAPADGPQQSGHPGCLDRKGYLLTPLARYVLTCCGKSAPVVDAPSWFIP